MIARLVDNNAYRDAQALTDQRSLLAASHLPIRSAADRHIHFGMS